MHYLSLLISFFKVSFILSIQGKPVIERAKGALSATNIGSGGANQHKTATVRLHRNKYIFISLFFSFLYLKYFILLLFRPNDALRRLSWRVVIFRFSFVSIIFYLLRIVFLCISIIFPLLFLCLAKFFFFSFRRMTFQWGSFHSSAYPES